ncbi:hypothetical protein C1645_741987 [Glomus cerebriforme]|uniref:Uncharacterized protein n=1 Tax=Glomus cerebriforme TaxID=658196 RepID=A0A397SFA0_9GLOM|nr:hypothetical protein C1645_741987 [Glomus cerebriforme]
MNQLIPGTRIGDVGQIHFSDDTDDISELYNKAVDFTDDDNPFTDDRFENSYQNTTQIRKIFSDIGYNNFLSWWEDEKVFHDDSTEEDIIISFFCEKFESSNDFMEIVNNDHFSLQASNALIDIYRDFLEIIDNYTPWEWLSWYIHMIYMYIRSPAPCPFQSSKVSLPIHIKHFHYEGTISKFVKKEEINEFDSFIRNKMNEIEMIHPKSLTLWYHGTHSTHAASILEKIDLIYSHHFGHAFGFHGSFYIGDNLKYCILRAIKLAGVSNVNCALMIFNINENQLNNIQEHLKLICRANVNDISLSIGRIWEEIVPVSRNSNVNHDNLNDDPISPNVHWVEGANLERINDTWVPKDNDNIRSFRTTESTAFLHSQLTHVITFRNPRV